MTEAERSRLTKSPSQLLLVPRHERAKPIFYGVECFSPTLIDFYSVGDDTRLLWSSRVHRKTFRTLHIALDPDAPRRWLLHSWSFYSALFSVLGATLFLYASANEAAYHPHATTQTTSNLTQTDFPLSLVRETIDLPLLLGAASFIVAYLLTFLEVINCCHDLDLWLNDYIHGLPSRRKKKWVGYYPYRIDYWSAVLGILGWAFLLHARGFVCRHELNVFGVVNLTRGNPRIFWGFWIPSLVGYFSLSMSAYLMHVEVIHRWFVIRLGHLDYWVTGLGWLGILLLFTCSFTQFIDPLNLFVADATSMRAFQAGAWALFASGVLSLFEVNALHSPLRHPAYGKLRRASSSCRYGAV
ncbi:hypothetical protein SPRG_05190 [Saprolegnia parasitica CBS 223.65]|uniref:Uncharacterized protein n=1 Tax=Saprolegnia parasitica (strain CBS 223.65) TaxID=695850 RepID=A0A067CTX3_SAPPC|nr:hypothetical protein SPRG_05190 [Saprolegnia parasitica CBS 223.65]KDO30001.1 hypothetical protein SPRG_05190 [Saprolegnia parasitica CBS 223.65]|eukprot:XP_012199184.1 hypothetical protein SPRG_05190 [Saprolegnia parasitica CBS 223.65]